MSSDYFPNLGSGVASAIKTLERLRQDAHDLLSANGRLLEGEVRALSRAFDNLNPGQQDEVGRIFAGIIGDPKKCRTQGILYESLRASPLVAHNGVTIMFAVATRDYLAGKIKDTNP